MNVTQPKAFHTASVMQRESFDRFYNGGTFVTILCPFWGQEDIFSMLTP
jgi:hypothetical protein